MITVISGTNRRDSECLRFAGIYAETLQEHTNEEVKLLALEQIPHDWFHPDMYSRQSPGLAALQDEYILPATKFAFFIPEYNGSFPGAVKLFIDACSVRHYKINFKGKKAALIGIATGRAGNIRGLEHLTSILNFLGTIVMPNKLPISQISGLRDGGGEAIDEQTLEVMRAHALEFLAF